MAKSVQDALAQILVDHQGIDLLEANKTLIGWIASKKYLRDLVSECVSVYKIYTEQFFL